MMKMKKVLGKIRANNVSGAEGCIYLGSVLAKCVLYSDKNSLFKFHFYGGSIKTKEALWKEYIRTELFEKETKKILDYIQKKKNAGYFWKRANLVIKNSKEFEKTGLKLKDSMKLMPDGELKKSYKEFMDRYLAYYSLGGITFIYESFISQLLVDSLSERYDGAADIINQAAKTNFKSFMIESEELLKKIKNTKERKLGETLIREFMRRFYYIETNYNGAKVLGKKDVEMLAKGITEKKEPFNKKIRMKNIKLNEEEKNIILLMKPTVMIRDARKKINLIGSYVMYRFLEEVSKRTKVKEEALKNALWFELMRVFEDKNLARRLENRKYFAFYYNEGKIFYSENIIFEDLKKEGGGNVLKGMVTASMRDVEGTVKIVHGPMDFEKFKEGEILVAFATRPEFVPLMKKAKAILTQEGGITSHAAIISRELGIPCVVGVNNLVDSLEDGDLVKIGANGLVTVLRGGK